MAKPQYLRIHFKNAKNNESAHLHFLLETHPFVAKWQKALSKARTLPILTTVFTARREHRGHILAVSGGSVDILNGLATDSPCVSNVAASMNQTFQLNCTMFERFERGLTYMARTATGHRKR